MVFSFLFLLFCFVLLCQCSEEGQGHYHHSSLSSLHEGFCPLLIKTLREDGMGFLALFCLYSQAWTPACGEWGSRVLAGWLAWFFY